MLVLGSHLLMSASVNAQDTPESTGASDATAVAEDDAWLNDVRASFGETFGDLTPRWTPQPPAAENAAAEESSDSDSDARAATARVSTPGSESVDPSLPAHRSAIE